MPSTVSAMSSAAHSAIVAGLASTQRQLVSTAASTPSSRSSSSGSATTLEANTGAELAHAVRALFSSPYDGGAKLWLALRALGLRREHAELFGSGDYRPIEAAGARAKHVVAYARSREREGVIVVAGRLFASLGLDPGVLPVGDAAWAGTTIDVGFLAPGTAMRNVLTGETVIVDGDRLPLARACESFPGALFVYERGA